MNCRLKKTEHLLIDFFNTVDHQMAILELKNGKLIFNRLNRSIAKLLKLPTARLNCRPLDEFVVLDGLLERWLEGHKSDPNSPSAFTFDCQLRSRTPSVWAGMQNFPP